MREWLGRIFNVYMYLYPSWSARPIKARGKLPIEMEVHAGNQAADIHAHTVDARSGRKASIL